MNMSAVFCNQLQNKLFASLVDKGGAHIGFWIPVPMKWNELLCRIFKFNHFIPKKNKNNVFLPELLFQNISSRTVKPLKP